MLGRIAIITASEIISQGLLNIFRELPELEVTKFLNEDELQRSELLEEFQAYITDNELKSGIDKKKIIFISSIGSENSDRIITLYDNSEHIKDKVLKFLNINTTEKISLDNDLTKRETEVLRLIATGLINKEIADKLCISMHTVISHRKNITEKLGIKSISGLTVYAIINGIINTDNINPKTLI